MSAFSSGFSSGFGGNQPVYLIPGGGSIEQPGLYGEYLIPGGGIVSFQAAPPYVIEPNYIEKLIHPQSELIREPNLLIPRKKPVGNVKINWDHPFNKNLEVCVLFNNEQELNYVRGKKYSITGSYIRDVDINGQYVDIDSSLSNYLMIDGLEITLPFTIFLSFMPNALGNYMPVMSLGNSTNALYHDIRHETTNSFRIVTFDESNSPFITLGDISIGGFYSVGGTIDESFRHGILNNGTLVSDTVTTVFTDTITRATFGISADNTPYTGLDARYYVAYIWNEQKSEAFLRSMYHDPYQLLMPA